MYQGYVFSLLGHFASVVSTFSQLC